MSRSAMPQTSAWSSSATRASSRPSRSRMTRDATSAALRHQRRQQGRPSRQVGEQDVLVLGVRAIALDAEPIERRDAERGGEVAVAAAAARSLAEVEAE